MEGHIKSHAHLVQDFGFVFDLVIEISFRNAKSVQDFKKYALDLILLSFSKKNYAVKNASQKIILSILYVFYYYFFCILEKENTRTKSNPNFQSREPDGQG